jgi:tRNA A37 methylthiotransferase MiaB
MLHIRSQIHDAQFALNNLNPANVLGDIDNYLQLINNGIILHLNLPIQSASDNMLKAMNREYRHNDLVKLYSLLRGNNFTAHDTHLLVGFPGETDEDIDITLQFLCEYKPRYILLSRFMSCKGTPADILPNKISDEIAYTRIQRIVEKMEAIGIICNYDNSEISITRRQRLAQD